MCSHFEAIAKSEAMKQYFNVDNPIEPYKTDVWPNYQAPFIRKSSMAVNQDGIASDREALLGRFGMIPHWSRDDKITRFTYNARSETVAEKPSFRDAWRRGQHAIIPLQAFYEPDWRTGKAVSTRIGHVSGEPMGVAGLWSEWVDSSSGEIVHSFTMLTINADQHDFMRNFHKVNEEKRMIVILPSSKFDDWLSADKLTRESLLEAFPAEELSGL